MGQSLDVSIIFHVQRKTVTYSQQLNHIKIGPILVNNDRFMCVKTGLTLVALPASASVLTVQHDSSVLFMGQ